MTKEELIKELGFTQKDLRSKTNRKQLNEARVNYHIGLVEKCGYTLLEAAEIANRAKSTIKKSLKKGGREEFPKHAQKLIKLAEGVTSEVMVPDFATIKQPKRIFRMDNNGRRYYYRFVNELPDFLTSMTTLIKNTLPMSEQVFKWAIDSFRNYDEYWTFLNERANYGTFLHCEVGRLLMKRVYNINAMKEYLELYIAEHRLDHSFINHLSELKKDLMAFAKFAIDRKLKVVAIEMVLGSKDGYGGALDIVCEMYIGKVYMSGVNAGLPKEEETQRGLCIVDIKSGRKGFFESHEVQLAGYRDMWNEHFPDMQIEKVFNWAPSGWTTTPKYKLKDQTNSKNAEKLPYLIALNKIIEEGRVKKATTINGQIDLDKEEYGNVDIKELSEIVLNK